MPPLERPPKPTPPAPPSSLWPVLLALLGAAAAIALMVFLSLGAFGNVVLLVLVLAAFGAVQYLLWGYWLGRSIRRQAERDGATAEDLEQDFWTRRG